MRILLAEDNPVNQQVALKTLEKLGYRADAVGNGAEALEALARRRYDLVLMDVQMPEMDGMEATRRIRDPRSAVLDHARAHRRPHRARDEGRPRRCLAAGMDDYLSKPIKPDELATVLARWTGRRTGPEPAVGLTRGAPAAEGGAGRRRRRRRPAPTAGRRAAGVRRAPSSSTCSRGTERPSRRSPTEFLDGRATAGRRRSARRWPAGDTALARRQAHTLKGASANVGAEALRAAAYRAELACADWVPAGRRGGSRSALDAELARLQHALGERRGAS